MASTASKQAIYAPSGNTAAVTEAAGAGGASLSVGDGQTAPQAPAVATDTRTEPQLKEQLVIEGWLSLEVDDVTQAALAIRTQAESMGGRVVNENLTGSSKSWHGNMQLKLPPAQVDAFLSWFDGQGEITSKRIQNTDVSRTLFDQEIALQNLTLTLDRLRKLLDSQTLEMKDILAVEKEMTRLRGEIERIKGEKRWLEHRVALATLEIQLRRREGVVLGPRAKLFPGPKFSTLTLIDPEGRARTRLGGGLVIHTTPKGTQGKQREVPRVTLELDVFEAPDGESRSVLVTAGAALYSDFLGRGRRALLNPYIGARLGYGYLGGSAFVFSGEIGVELFKHEKVMIDTSVQVMGFAREQFDVGVVGSASLVVPF